MNDKENEGFNLEGRRFYIIRYRLVPPGPEEPVHQDPQLVCDAERMTNELIARIKAGLDK